MSENNTIEVVTTLQVAELPPCATPEELSEAIDRASAGFAPSADAVPQVALGPVAPTALDRGFAAGYAAADAEQAVIALIKSEGWSKELRDAIVHGRAARMLGVDKLGFDRILALTPYSATAKTQEGRRTKQQFDEINAATVWFSRVLKKAEIETGEKPRGVSTRRKDAIAASIQKPHVNRQKPTPQTADANFKQAVQEMVHNSAIGATELSPVAKGATILEAAPDPLAFCETHARDVTNFMNLNAKYFTGHAGMLLRDACQEFSNKIKLARLAFEVEQEEQAEAQGETQSSPLASAPVLQITYKPVSDHEPTGEEIAQAIAEITGEEPDAWEAPIDQAA
jgi:hypothetical protein